VEKYSKARQATDDIIIQQKKKIFSLQITKATNTYKQISYLLFLQQNKIFCSSTTLQKNPTVVLHGNTEYFYTDNYSYANNKKDMYCCSSMEKMVMKMHHNAMYVQC